MFVAIGRALLTTETRRRGWVHEHEDAPCEQSQASAVRRSFALAIVGVCLPTNSVACRQRLPQRSGLAVCLFSVA